jgi:sulfatase maturation enzyme AslB (radical SAM superfamily)
MPEAVMARALSLAANSGTPFHLQFTGGEPTLVPAAIEKAVTLAHATGICRTIFCHACRAESLAEQPDGGIFPCGQTMGDAHFAARTFWAPRLDR